MQRPGNGAVIAQEDDSAPDLRKRIMSFVVGDATIRRVRRNPDTRSYAGKGVVRYNW